MKKIVLLLNVCLLSLAVYGQTDTVSTGKKDEPSLDELSLEDLMNVPIVSASREKENLFDAPVTSYVITRQEIEKAGSTSIPEALRLCPALFVTEISNGTYSVDIRGLNNAPAFDYSISSKTLLVMVDNRPVFNQLQGGTFWSNLPVDINDVERIEVVAGPSAALYGPNAVTGVVNIITRRLNKDGLFGYSNSQFDALTRSAILNASAGYQFNQKFSFIVNANYNNRQRFTDELFNTVNNRYEPYNEAFSNVVIPAFQKDKLYPNPMLASQRFGTNIFATYKPSERIKFDLDGGYNQSNSLGSIAIGVGPAIAYFNSNSVYGRARAEVYGFSFQGSQIIGRQAFMGGVKPYQYDFRTTDMYLDYTYKFKEFFSVKPAISYQEAYINDLPYKDLTVVPGIFNNQAVMENWAASFKFEAAPVKFIRAVAAVRADRFTYPKDKPYFSYEFVLNVKPSPNHNIRLVYSRAYQGSFIFPTFVDFSTGPTSNFRGNKSLDPAKVDLMEVGYRLKISDKLSADLSIFAQEGSSYYQLLATNWRLTMSGTTTGIAFDLVPTNLDLRVLQGGATLSFNVLLFNNKVQIKPFATLQRTYWNNYSPYQNTPNPILTAFGQPDNLNSNTKYNIVAKATPTLFGGGFINVNPIEKLNINLNGYMFTDYSLYGLGEQPSSQPRLNNPPGAPNPRYRPGEHFIPSNASEISGKILLNAKVSFQVLKYLKVYANARNILNNRSREFYGSDQIGAMILAGIHFEY